MTTRLFQNLFKLVWLSALVFGLYIVSLLVYGSISEHHFKEFIKLSSEEKHNTFVSDSTFELITWNVGFFGLGEESDFFYDGGQAVFQTKETVLKNFRGVKSFAEQNKHIDFFLLQEVDSFSWRSHGIDFSENDFLGYAKHRALNYASAFVPIPFLNPMGPTFSGLLSMSKLPVKEAFRFDLRTESYWPKRIFFLKRCFLVQRIPLNEKDLVVVNVHNSAYDKTGDKNNKEMQRLLDFVEKEYSKGNYIVIGGDWNQSPPSYVAKDIPKAYRNIHFTNDDIPRGWKWVADTTVPTNRKLDKPYSKNESYTSVIDHYLVSPNLRVDSVEVIDLDFAYSDHQPVYLKVSIGR